MITKHKLVKLVVCLLWNFMVVCLNLGLCKITLFLPSLLLAWMWKGTETLAVRRGSQEGWKTT